MITTIFTYNAANELIKVCTHIVQYLPKSDIANNKDYFYGLQRMKIIVFIVIIFSKSNIAYAQNNGSNLGLRFVNFNNEFKQTNNYNI